MIGLEGFKAAISSVINTIVADAQAWSAGIRHYQQLIVPGLVLLGFIFVLRLIQKKQKALIKAKRKNQLLKTGISSKDIEMVAGEDVVTTQLDLARAYIEMGKRNLAKSILFHVKKHGKEDQQVEARRLIKSLEVECV